MSLVTISAIAVLAAGCDPAGVLEVEDPDIINPANVQSAAGAEAVRLGALARFVGATSGDESYWMLGGLFADEWINGDSFIARQEIDQRVITPENGFLTSANRQLHRVRLSAAQAIALIRQFNPTAPAWQIGEMFMLQAYTITLMAEHVCDGLIISEVVEGREVYGQPITTTAAFERALGLANEGLAAVTGTTAHDVRVRHALALVRGRILLNLNRPAEAATAVSAVPTAYAYTHRHSLTTWSNTFWTWNRNARRFSVGNNEGTNGLNFATAADPRVPVCHGNDTACRAIGVTNSVRDDLGAPFHVFMASGREDPVNIMQGVDARMIEAEAQHRAGNFAAALVTMNAARATRTGLAPLTDPGTADARVNLIFRERAFWQFSRGYRTGDLRRLIRQYGRAQTAVFPIGTWHKGGNYGTDVNFPTPLAEQNNPNLGLGAGCMNRGA